MARATSLWFTLALRFAEEAGSPGDIVGNAGVGIAGDAFDAKIIRHLVSPALGAGSQLRSLGKILTVPNWVYIKLERWHHLSLLRAKDVLDMLSGVHAQSLEPEKIGALIHFIKEDLGFHLHRAVQKVKCDLSNAPVATFQFSDGFVDLKAVVERTSFEEWISEELEQIARCVDSLLTSSGVHPKDVDMVFLTGGSSFVPAVRRIFESRFGEKRIRGGNEFTSVARGLALKAMHSHISASRLADEAHDICNGRIRDRRLIAVLFGCLRVGANQRRVTLARRQKQVALQAMLLGVEIEVTTAQCIEFFVSATFDNLSPLHHQNLIGTPNGRQTVRDHKGSAALHQVREALLDHLLGFGIEARSRLVQNQNAGLSQNGASN